MKCQFRFTAAISSFLAVFVVASCGTAQDSADHDSPAKPAADSAADSTTHETVYWDQARSVLKKRCFTCHRGDQPRGGLDMTSLTGIEAGSTSGAAVVGGQPLKSPLFLLAAHLEEPMMPPNSPRIPQRELDVLQQWIEGGLQTREVADSEDSSPTANGRSLSRRPAELLTRTTIALPFVPPRRIGAPQDSLHSASPAERLQAALSVPKRPARIHSVASSAITAIAVSPTSSQIAVASGRSVSVWHWPDQTLQQTLPQDRGDVFCLRYSRDGQLLLIAGGVGAESGSVIAADSATGETIFQTSLSDHVVLSADLSPSGRYLAFGGPKRTTMLWDTVQEQTIAELKRHTDWVLDVRFSPDELLLATADRFGSIQVWDAVSGEEFGTLRGHTGPVSSLHWHAKADQLTSTGHDGTIRRWDLNHLRQTSIRAWDGGPILTSDLFADGRLLVGGRNGCWQLLTTDSTTSDAAMQTAALPADLTHIAMTQDGTHLIAADAAGNVRLFDAATLNQVGQISLPNESR